MSPPSLAPFSADGDRPLPAVAFAAGLGALAVGVAGAAVCLALLMDGPFSSLYAVAEMTAGQSASPLVVAVWAYGDAFGLPVTLSGASESGAWVVVRHVAAGRPWVAAVSALGLALAGWATARLSGWDRTDAGGFAAGAAVAIGYAPAFALLAAVARVGLGDATPGPEGYVLVGSTQFPPEAVADEAVGLRPWRTLFVALAAPVVVGGVGGLASSWLSDR